MSHVGQPESYRKTQIETASPEALILMLYDGALRFIGYAEEAFEKKDIEAINNNLLRVQSIIAELLTALDKEKGGEIAINLERIYLFFLEKLAQANIEKEPKHVRDIKPLIETLRDTWAEIVKKHAKNSPPPPPGKRLNISV